jgi:putative component of toxin-antitoxin plasmid stabilization module
MGTARQQSRGGTTSLTKCAIGVIGVIRIVRTNRYLKDIKRLRASQSDVEALESMIARSPFNSDVVPGMRGIRKVRFAFGGRGKRGGGRAVYFLQVTDELIVMLNAFAKNEREDLTEEQKKIALLILKEFEND